MSRSDKQFKKNQIVTVRIDDLTDLGFGVGRIGNAVIFVNDAIPGDEAEVRIIKVARDYLVGRIERILTPSPHRTAVPHCTVRGCVLIFC